jgi:hypothetical protein
MISSIDLAVAKEHEQRATEGVSLQEFCEALFWTRTVDPLLTMEVVFSGMVGIGIDCKRSASIKPPRRCHRVPPKCTPAAENRLGACISAEYGGTRVRNRGGS